MSGDSIENYQNAINLFESIPGWKDADEQIIVCEDKIREIEAKDEAEKKEVERKAKIARQEAEIKAKKKKKIAIISGATLCIIIAFILILTKVIIPSVNYNKAMDLYKSGDLENAYTIFQDLGDYKDSVNIAKRIQFKVVKPGIYIRFGKYEKDNDESNGQEDIEWLVLDKQDNKILVISKYALDCKTYNTDFTDVTWESCSLRSWLNNDFINTAFNDEEKAMIPTVTVNADNNPSHDTDPGKDTNDKVFLLSINEAEKYFSSDDDRKCEATSYADANGASNNYSDFCWWWLRTPGHGQKYAADVRSDGGIREDGYRVNGNYDAVRPALWINLNS